jgi:hypothetical protein
MIGIWLDTLVPATVDRNTIASGVAALLLLLIAFTAGQAAKRRRVDAVLQAVDAATVGRVTPRSRTDAGGFAVAINPAPEPFREFSVSYRCLSILDPIDVMRRLRGQVSRLQVAGNLPDPPTAELVWARGLPPAHVLGKTPGRGQWVFHRLELAATEFGTRGSDVAALRHVFREMISRHSPDLKQISLQRERRPMLRLVVEGTIDLRDISPLITSARALARAGLRR